MNLTNAEKKELLTIARSSIASGVKGARNQNPSPSSDTLQIPCGAFVTLKLHGELRGCIGYIEPRVPLYKTIGDVARKAAFEDPRFLPLLESEFNEIEIEISVMSPLQEISDPEEIIVGTHGLVVDAGYTRGLLLPQVATEYGWNRDTFLMHTCKKAGLPGDAWQKKNVTLFIFTSAVFSESELEHHHP
ncbi:MAG: AmmeMemoRadiSam system protein A [bacterium]